MNTVTFIIFILLSVFIYITEPFRKRRWGYSRLGSALGLSSLVTGFIMMVWSFMSWLGLWIISFLTRMF